MTNTKVICIVCGRLMPLGSGQFCRSCGRSFERRASRGKPLLDWIFWASGRARAAAEADQRHRAAKKSRKP